MQTPRGKRGGGKGSGSHDLFKTCVSLHLGKQFYKVHKMEPSLMEAGQVVANTDWECSVMVKQTSSVTNSQHYLLHMHVQ